MRKKRYEILLPLKFNDGQPVPPESFEQTREELVGQFGAISYGPSVTHGIWIHEGVRYEDDLFRFSIDVDDTEENRLFFVSLKNLLLERFKQIEIYLASYPIERL
jgi:hypothetical protein